MMRMVWNKIMRDEKQRSDWISRQQFERNLLFHNMVYRMSSISGTGHILHRGVKSACVIQDIVVFVVNKKYVIEKLGMKQSLVCLVLGNFRLLSIRLTQYSCINFLITQTNYVFESVCTWLAAGSGCNTAVAKASAQNQHGSLWCM